MSNPGEGGGGEVPEQFVFRADFGFKGVGPFEKLMPVKLRMDVEVLEGSSRLNPKP